MHWSQRFCQDQGNTEDKTRCGRLITSRDNISAAIIVTILKEDRHMTCTEIAMKYRIPKSFVRLVLTEVMGKRKLTVLWVLHTSDEQMIQKEITMN